MPAVLMTQHSFGQSGDLNAGAALAVVEAAIVARTRATDTAMPMVARRLPSTTSVVLHQQRGRGKLRVHSCTRYGCTRRAGSAGYGEDRGVRRGRRVTAGDDGSIRVFIVDDHRLFLSGV